MHHTPYFWSKSCVNLKSIHSVYSILCIFQERLAILKILLPALTNFQEITVERLFYIFLFLTLISTHSLLFAHNTSPYYDLLSINRGIWKKIDIVYNQDFPYKKNYSNQNIKGCKKTYISPASNNKTEIKKTVPVLRCIEHIKLLRPDKTVRHWVQIQHEKHFLPLTLNTLNFVNMHAKITAIYPVKSENQQHFLHNRQTKIVTGQFERHTVNVKKYTFRNMKTGKITTVNATPEHPVYVKNRAAFIPMDLLLKTDYLLSSAGQEIRLICPENRIQHCGISLYNNIPRPVYNLEIHHNRIYFVSNIGLLVHNICQLAKKLHKSIPDLIQSKEAPGEEEENFLSLKSREDVQRTVIALREIERDNMACDSYIILSLSLHWNEYISIKKLEVFLKERKARNLEVYTNLFYTHIGVKELISLDPETAFSIILPIAREQPVVAMTKKHCSLIIPDASGMPVLEGLTESTFQIQYYPLDMSPDQVNSFYASLGHTQPIKYCTLKKSTFAAS